MNVFCMMVLVERYSDAYEKRKPPVDKFDWLYEKLVTLWLLMYPEQEDKYSHEWEKIQHFICEACK